MRQEQIAPRLLQKSPGETGNSGDEDKPDEPRKRGDGERDTRAPLVNRGSDDIERRARARRSGEATCRKDRTTESDIGAHAPRTGSVSRRTVARWAETFRIQNSLKTLAKIARLLLEQEVDHGGRCGFAWTDKRLKYHFERCPALC